MHSLKNYNLHQLETVDSTNEEARRLVAAGFDVCAKPVWIIAKRQSAGRGRLGRVWSSPEGNLMCTLIIAPQIKREKLAEIAFVAGLALYDGVHELVPEAKLSLKWPNDVLLEGAKLSGILIESLDHQRGILAVGLGLNLAHYPDDTPYQAISLKAASGQDFPAQIAFEAVAAQFDIWLQRWEKEGFTPIHESWCQRAHGIGGVGAQIIVNLPNGKLEGVFEALSADGQLVLRDNQGVIHHITAGDVYFQTEEKK